MHVSGARVAANRQNALKSTGPKSAEGKAISRRNGLVHGLSGSGAVLLEDDAAEVARRVEALEADLQPRSPVGVVMVARMAALSVRMEKAAGRELAAVAKNVRHASANHDEAMLDEADTWFEGLADDPRKNLRKLKRTPEGVDRLIEAWEDLRDELARDLATSWTADHLDRITLLTGKKTEKGRDSALGGLCRAINGDFAGLSKSDGAGLGDEARKAWAKAQLAGRIEAEIDALIAHRETLDLGAFEQDRIEAPALALFDASKEATLARRYESEAHRGFFQALKEFRRAEAEFAERANAEAATPSTPPGLGSSRVVPPSPAFEPRSEVSRVPSTTSSVANGPDGSPLVIGRTPTSGR